MSSALWSTAELVRTLESEFGVRGLQDALMLGRDERARFVGDHDAYFQRVNAAMEGLLRQGARPRQAATPQKRPVAQANDE